MDELDSITILKSYVESVDELARGDIQLAQELSYWIIQYGIKGIEPPEDTNPYVMSPFKQIKKALDKGRNKGKCAKKDSEDEDEENQNEIKTKSNGNQIEIKTESNGNQIEIKTESNDDKNKNKNKKENNISLSKDNEEEKSSYGNEDINECLEIIKSFNGGMIDGTQKWNRIYGKNLIGKLSNSPPVKNGNYTWQETLKAILQVISQNKYHRSKIANPKTIYDNLTLLFQICNEEGQTKKIPVIPTL